jgi:hypothetical protein
VVNRWEELFSSRDVDDSHLFPEKTRLSLILI